jgi:hypothetical protein
MSSDYFTRRVRDDRTVKCAGCGLPREEHIANWWCPDALDVGAMYEPEDDPRLLRNILMERLHDET